MNSAQFQSAPLPDTDTDMDMLAELLDAQPWPDTDMDALNAMLGPMEALNAMLDTPPSAPRRHP